MTASESSRIGLAKQVGKGTPNTTDGDFTYLLFREGGLAINNTFLPLEPEVGGGSMARNVLKTGVMGAGALSIIPRPKSLGLMLYGLLGSVETDKVLIAHALDGSTVTSGFSSQPAYSQKVTIVASGSATGNVVIDGTKTGGSAETDTIALNGSTPVESVKSFISITSVTLPTVSNRTITISLVTTDVHSHVFKHATDSFTSPWFTGRQDVGNMWGEQFPDVKIAGLTLAWRGGRFVEGEAALVGSGTPSKVTTTTWLPDPKVDGGPQFIAPLGTIKLPSDTTVAVTAGSFTGAVSMPVDEQWVVGSYSPQGLDIVQRAYVLNLLVKITDGDLVNKIQLDPAGGSSWVASAFRESDFLLKFLSYESIGTDAPYSFAIQANGQSDEDANVVWTARPISMRAGRQIILSVTGTFLASPDGTTDPIRVVLVNGTASY